VYKKGAPENSRRVLRVKKRRTQVVLESAASHLSRCDNFGPWRKYIDWTQHYDCGAILDWEDKAPIRGAVYALESGWLQWPDISEKVRQNIKVAMAGLNSKQITWKQLDLAVRQNDRVICHGLSKRFADMTEMVDSKIL
jgi:hypothetical protein